jgi:hypothetical protein
MENPFTGMQKGVGLYNKYHVPTSQLKNKEITIKIEAPNVLLSDSTPLLSPHFHLLS